MADCVNFMCNTSPSLSSFSTGSKSSAGSVGGSAGHDTVSSCLVRAAAYDRACWERREGAGGEMTDEVKEGEGKEREREKGRRKGRAVRRGVGEQRRHRERLIA